MAKQEKNLPPMSVDESEIARFLQATPAFFERHQELLLSMRLPHASGKAISLLERQMSLLREKNRALENKLLKLVQRAHDNEALAERLHRFTISLLDSKTLPAALITIQDTLLHEFDVDQVNLRLIAWPEFQHTALEAEQLISVADADTLFPQFFAEQRVLCGRGRSAQIEFLFGENAKAVKSVALIPLHNGCNFGLLALASGDSQRFQASLGVHFLNQIGELLSTRLKTWLAPL